jgi:hypothetical protein
MLIAFLVSVAALRFGFWVYDVLMDYLSDLESYSFACRRNLRIRQQYRRAVRAVRAPRVYAGSALVTAQGMSRPDLDRLSLYQLRDYAISLEVHLKGAWHKVGDLLVLPAIAASTVISEAVTPLPLPNTIREHLDRL